MSKGTTTAGKVPRPKRNRNEQKLQEDLFEWVREEGKYIFPELEAFRSITSGQARFGASVSYVKKAGMEGGYPDTHLAVSRGGYASLWIELKAPGNKSNTSKAQKDRIADLTRNGNLVFVLDKLEDIKSVLESYCLGFYVRARKPDWIPLPPSLH